MWLIVPISNDDCALSGDEDETYEEKLRVGGWGEREGRRFGYSRLTSHDCKEQRAKLLDWAGRLAWPVGAQTFAWSRQRPTEVANEGDSHRVTE